MLPREEGAPSSGRASHALQGGQGAPFPAVPGSRPGPDLFPGRQVMGAAALAAAVFITVGLPRILIHTDFDVDYGLWGVMLPVLVYFGRGKWGKLALFAVGVGLLGLHYGGAQWWGLLSVPLLALYNGKKGTWNIGPLFYWYYPAHLVAIYGLSLLLERAAG